MFNALDKHTDNTGCHYTLVFLNNIILYAVNRMVYTVMLQKITSQQENEKNCISLCLTLSIRLPITFYPLMPGVYTGSKLVFLLSVRQTITNWKILVEFLNQAFILFYNFINSLFLGWYSRFLKRLGKVSLTLFLFFLFAEACNNEMIWIKWFEIFDQFCMFCHHLLFIFYISWWAFADKNMIVRQLSCLLVCFLNFFVYFIVNFIQHLIFNGHLI